MSALADELGVNRVTLYRWVGSRDQLLVEVIWSLARRTLDDAEARRAAAAPSASCRSSSASSRRSSPARACSAGSRRRASTRCGCSPGTRPTSSPGSSRAIDDLLSEEADAGRLDLPVDLQEVAYVIVRLIESYTYLDLITGERPDARRAEPILRMLLR